MDDKVASLRQQGPKPEGYIDDIQYITEYLLPEWRKIFDQKNRDYGEDSGKLGLAGGVVDIWRKSHKLKRALWDGKTLHGEQPRELTFDMIGHCFLLLIDLDGDEQMRQRLAEDGLSRDL